jgi:hypothetical protein
MKIHLPRLEQRANEIVLSARVEFDTPGLNTPDILWFAVPERFSDFVTDRADGFATALLIAASYLGEDMQVEGDFSPLLRHNLAEYLRALFLWHPGKFQPIEIQSSRFSRADTMPPNRGILTAFSGGVDSFYTLQQHLPANEPKPGFPISHVLFVHGFDIFLEDQTTYHTCAEAYTVLIRRLGIEMIPMRTNLRHFTDKIVNWKHCWAVGLSGAAMMLAQSVERFYVPGADTYATRIYPQGGNAYNVGRLSTEGFTSDYDGAGTPRIEKIRHIAEWPETYSLLRVCWEKPDGLRNCCRCDKCLRTMIALDIFGKLDVYKTFPLKLTRAMIRQQRYKVREHVYLPAILAAAAAAGRQDIVFDVRVGLLLTRVERILDPARRLVKRYWRSLQRRLPRLGRVS